jgi:putative sterol carrier protein
MAQATKRFFEALAERKNVPAIRALSGTLRFDLKDGERIQHWYVTVRKGQISVSHSAEKADCVFTADVRTFEAMLAGKMNPFAAVLRGVCTIEGRVRMVVALQSLFAPSEGAPTQAAGYAGRPT